MRAIPWLVLALGGCGLAIGDGDDAPDDLPRTCLAPEADRAGTAGLADALGTASVDITELTPCLRQYTLASTAARRDDQPASPRVYAEREGRPTLRTGNDLFDALYALALDEVDEASVDAIHDGAFAGGAPLPCPAGGCFETGALWTYVWTRDVSYAVDLGLAELDPQRARNSLEFKLSAPRTGGAEEIVQDTGSGGSYPVSSDRVVWALGVAALLPQLDDAGRAELGARAYAALRATIEHDRGVVFDAVDGLYRGEQSFLDWREQSYPAWTAHDVAPIAASEALSTNVLHLRALEVTAQLGATYGDAADAARYTQWADAVRAAIRARFWLDDAGLYATFSTELLDPAPARQFDLLGSALAITSGVATPAQAARIVASYPHAGPGSAPVIFPEQQLTPIYHNRAEWPFVTAYWLRAAAVADHAPAADRAVRALMRGAALNLSNMENLELATGAPWVDDGPYAGPVVDSRRQLWSVAGYISMVHHTLFGLRFDGDALDLAPYVSRDLRDTLFAGTDALILDDVPWRGTTTTIVLHLPAAGGDGGGSYRVGEVTLNGAPVSLPLAFAALAPHNRLDVTLVAPAAIGPTALDLRDTADWRAIFAPRVPAITAVRRDGGGLAIDLDAGGEDTATIHYNVYRDGDKIAHDVAGTATSYVDAAANPAASPCYAVETCFATQGPGTCSQRARAACWWGDDASAITSVPASAFEATGGVAASDHGRFHYGDWGDPGDELVIPSVTAGRTGPHLLQLVYGNGAGPINTGITCAVKRLVVEDTATGAEVASEVVVMPQLGDWDRWADSTFARADLVAGKTYRITIKGDASTVNMSAFAHFIHYAGTGGNSGRFERVNIAELKLLAR
jgi:hypothetical protein